MLIKYTAPKPVDTVYPETASLRPEDKVKGSRDAKVLLVEYSDFQCPSCRDMAPIIKDLVSKYGGSMAFAYRHLPLPQHFNAPHAAYSAEAAGEQGKFWELHDKIFETQNEWKDLSAEDSVKRFREYAQALGLEMQKYDADVASESIRARVENNFQEARKMGLSSTPSIFLNGKRIQLTSYDQLTALVESAINP